MLNKQGIPFEKYGGLKFMDYSYVKDILAYLKVMINPYDEISWFRILQVHRGIGSVNARKIATGLKENGFEHLKDKKYAKRNYGPELILLYEQLQLCEGLELQKMIGSFVDFYIGTCKRNIESMDTDEGMRTQYLLENKAHAEDLQRLVEISESYTKIDVFLDDLMLDATAINDKSEQGNLVISTVHSVKGLEFNTVIVLDCVNGLFPSAETAGTKEDNEELRCFYVALTRAKEHLFLMSPKSASRYGRALPGIPSRYLEETKGLVRSNDKDFFSRFYEEPVSDYWGGFPRPRKNIWG
jgi:DNA helicase-2/ATP-dependent DNA helicase PcrA